MKQVLIFTKFFLNRSSNKAIVIALFVFVMLAPISGNNNFSNSNFLEISTAHAEGDGGDGGGGGDGGASGGDGGGQGGTIYWQHSIDTHPNVSVLATSPSGAVVTFSPPLAYQYIIGTELHSYLPVSCSPSSGSSFSFGSTLVTCSAFSPYNSTFVYSYFYVTVYDNIKPVITILGTNPINVPVGSVYVDQGAKAVDNVYGNISAKITKVNNVNTNILGTYTVSYNVSDASGNVATQVTRTVNVVDTTAPTITLLGANPVTISVGTVYTDAGVTASDNVGGNISANVVTTNSVNTSILGSYIVSYSVSDSSNNIATSSRTVNVVDTTSPVITLLGVNPISVNAGAVYNDAGATALDNINGNITANIVTTNTVNSAVVGSYTVRYNVSDASGNAATQVIRTVNVVDTTAPVITMIGSTPVNIFVGGTYTDAGAIAQDNINGNITASIVTTSTVNTAVVGNYTVSYNVSDASGNAATQVVRGVNVIATPDSTPPSNPVASSLSHVQGQATSSTSGVFNWTTSIDAGSGLAGYSFVLDSSTSTTPDNIVDTVSTTTNQTLTLGNTYYFHIKALDVAGNQSATSHIGPFVITDSTVTITNSTIGNVFYVLYSPSIASSTAFGITGSSTISGSTISGGSINNSSVSQSTLTTSTSTFSNILSSTSTNSTISSSNVTNSILLNTSVSSTTLNGSNINGATISSSTVTTSTVNGGTITNSNVSSSTLNNAIISSSTLSGTIILGSGTIIINSNVGSTTISNGIIINDVISGGSVTLPNGTVVIVSTSTPLANLINYAPIALFNATGTGALAASFTDLTSDVNEGTLVPDSWTYLWNFGDLSFIGGNFATTSNNQSHTYGNAGIYTVTLTVTDQYGLQSVATGTISVSSLPITFDIVASSSGTGVGTITPVGTTTVNLGGNQTYTITPSGTSTILSLIVDGVSIATSTTYAFNNVNSSHTIDVVFGTVAIPTFDIVSTISGNGVGVISPLGTTTLSQGSNQTYTITPNATSTIQVLTVDGISIATTTSYTFTNITSNHTIDVTFGTTTPVVPPTFDILSSTTGPGTISPAGTTTVAQGNNQIYTITPNASSSLISLIIDGSSVATTTLFTFTNVVANHTINATFATTSTPTFDIFSSSSGTGVGTITPLGTTTLMSGASQTYTITPNATSTIQVLTVDGISIATTTSYTFTNITSNHTIDVLFASTTAPITPSFNITSSVTGPGTISPLGVTSVLQGGSQLYTLTPNASSTLTGLAVDGVATTTILTFTFNNVQNAHTIAGFFATSSTPDTTAPTITILGLNPTSIVVGTTYTDQGATAIDNVDGNITANIITTNNVSTSTPGTYSVVYTVSDLAGNTATSTRIVNVLATADVTPPVITITGSSTVSSVINVTYLDLGATAFDNVDGNITANILATNGVDITTIGTYTVTYTVSDSSGNSATSTRTVNIIAQPIVDTISPSTPVITGVNTIATTTLGSTLNAVWTDSVDNSGSLAGYSFVWDTNATTNPDNIVESQATSSTVNLPNGTWYLHVIAVDPSLNVSTPTSHFGPIVINNLPVGDTTPPVGPTFATSSTHVTNVTSSSTAVSLSWDTATDNIALAGYSYIFDTNTTSTPDNIVETSLTSFNTNLPNGTWYFHVLSTDASGNVSTTTADFGPIIIATTTSDVTPPTGPTVVNSGTHTVSVPSIIQNVSVSWDTATDDSVLAGYSYIWDTVATTTPDAIVETTNTNLTTTLPNGTYFFHILSADTSGNVSTPVVHFGPIIINTNLSSDTTPPSSPIVTTATTSSTSISATWIPSTDNSGFLAGYSYIWDTNATTTPDAIVETQGTSTLTTITDGLWFFHIVAVDPSLNISTPTTHSGPIKIDTTIPVISLIGATTTAIVIGNVYVDLGATAIDNLDGNITSSIVSSSTVNTSVAGTYFVTYDVSDSSGNDAQTVTRTVIVLLVPDVTPPVITLLGTNPTNVAQNSVYTDAGVLATDNIDGNVTANVITTNLVNTAVLSTSTVSYSVTDSSGNLATSSRTVNVVPPTPFTLISTATGNGTISPLGTSTNLQGTNQTYTITPNSGHYILSLVVDGSSVATTTSHTFTNIQANHTVDVVFAAIPGSPTFTLVSTTGVNGSISPLATSTVALGNNQVYTITPNSGFIVGTLTIDGTATTSANSFTFFNVVSNHTIDVQFVAIPPDSTPPSNPVASSLSHVQGQATSSTSGVFNWTTSIDAGSGLAGYSFVLDSSTSTTPDNIVDTVSTTTNQTLTLGNTYYFHIKALDVAGNQSATSHIGPFVITDSTVTITNSTIDGIFYTFYAPTTASSSALNINGVSNIINSTLTLPWNLSNVNLDTVTLASSTLANTNATSSTITNSVLTGCNITNSLVKNYSATNCNIQSSVVDPASGLNDLTGTFSSASSIFYSDVTYSTSTNSYIATSTITNSVLTNSTSTDSTIASSTIINSTISTSTISLSNVNASTISASTLSNTVVATSTITNNSSISGGSVSNATLNQATSTNSTIFGGTITNSTLINSVSTGSAITGSTLTNSTSTNSTVSNSAINNSTLLNTSVSNSVVSTSSISGGGVASSTVASSTLTNATTSGSTITNSTVNNAVISSSTLTGVTILGASSTIIGTTLTNTTLTNAIIINGVMTGGSIVLPNGTTTVVISTSTPITSLVNYAPVSSFTTSVNNLVATITDTSSDPNLPSLPDSWSYLWNFGDSITANVNVATIGNNQSHIYGSAGTYTITLVITDQYGLSSTSSSNVIVSSAPISGGGGGGSTYGGSYFVSAPAVATSTLPVLPGISAVVTATLSKLPATSTGTKVIAKPIVVKKKVSTISPAKKDTVSAASVLEKEGWLTKIKKFIKKVVKKVETFISN